MGSQGDTWLFLLAIGVIYYKDNHLHKAKELA